MVKFVDEQSVIRASRRPSPRILESDLPSSHSGVGFFLPTNTASSGALSSPIAQEVKPATISSSVAFLNTKDEDEKLAATRLPSPWKKVPKYIISVLIKVRDTHGYLNTHYG